jgi:hypothetical protein
VTGPSSHSEFPASSAKALIACPGRFALVKTLPATGRKSSIFAAEGTVAHGLAEWALRTGEPLSDKLGKVMSADGFDFTVDQDMVDHVSVYVEYVRSLNALGYSIWLERRVSPTGPWFMTNERPPLDLFGTSDCVAVHPGLQDMVIADLKYGRGIAVEARDNAQLRYYALGTAGELGEILTSPPDLAGDPFGDKATVGTVTMTIVQPRAPHPEGPVRSETIFARDLVMWGVEVLRPAVERALRPGQPLAAGEHCKFCPALPVCPENRQAAQDKARHAFDEPVTRIAPDELAADLALADQLETWIKAIRQEAHERLEAGREIPGFKLVAKRATRSWNDEESVMALVAEYGIEEHALETKLKSPAQVLKRLEKDIAAVLNAHVSSNSSGTTLAPDTDPRPAVEARPAASATFKEDNE